MISPRLEVLVFVVISVLSSSSFAGVGSSGCHDLGLQNKINSSLDGQVTFRNGLSLTAASDQFRRAIVRNDSVQELDPTYRAHMFLAFELFDAWVRGDITYELIEEPIPFTTGAMRRLTPEEQLLNDMHRLAVLGRDGASIYWPNTLKSGEIKADAPSRERDARRSAGVPWYLLSDFKEAPKHRIKIPEGVREAVFKYRTEGRWQKETRGGIPYNALSWHPETTGIEEAGWPKNIYDMQNGEVFFEYPARVYQPKYMARIAGALGGLRVELSRDVLDRAAIESLVSEFYDAAIKSHRYHRVNNSLFMLIFNYARFVEEREPVTHGNHDYVVRSLATDEAKAYIAQEMIPSQPR